MFLKPLVPIPTSVIIISNPVSPVRPVESNVTVTCNVRLSPAVDVPVTVNFKVIDPVGSLLTTTTPSVSGSTYTSTAMVNTFGRSQSGEYTCRASISSLSPFLIDSGVKASASNITVGKILRC